MSSTVAADVEMTEKPEEKEATTTTTTTEMKEEQTNPDESKAANDKNDDDDSVSSTQFDDSDTDTAPKENPELLLIKAVSLKEAGNEFFKQKEYDNAARSYRRGTNALKPLNKGNTGDDQVKNLLISLQTNLSMMFFKLDKHKQSSQVATAALKIDSTNVKARYRRALARRKLGEHEEAKNDLREALKHDPGNMAAKKELASIKKELEVANRAQRQSLQKAFSKGGGGLYDDKEKEKRSKEEEERQKKKQEEEALKKRKVNWEDECVKRMARGDPALSFEEWEKEQNEKEEALAKQKQKEEKQKREAESKARAAQKEEARAAQKEEESDSDDELTERELAQLRGYKKTSDGRTTSYFSREQSFDEKNLIGDITPKRLEPTNSSSPINPSNASAWNQAGTWEEKDTTEWCHEHLISRLKETKAESGSLAAIVTEVKDMTGHASVAIVGGKKRYIFDFHCELNFEVRDPDTDDITAKGSLQLPDICSTHHEELDVNFGGWNESPSSKNEQVAMNCRLGLASEVRESVKLWVTDFNAKH
jgi:tetratricopeptide (TPR) repeat protein